MAPNQFTSSILSDTTIINQNQNHLNPEYIINGCDKANKRFKLEECHYFKGNAEFLFVQLRP
jgi:hypothetical protein